MEDCSKNAEEEFENFRNIQNNLALIGAKSELQLAM